MPTRKASQTKNDNRNGRQTYPMSRKRYYFTQGLFLGYMVLWLAGWYLIMKNGSGAGIVFQVLLFLLLLFTQPTGIPLQPYDKAMKRMVRLAAPPRGGEGDSLGDTVQVDPDADGPDVPQL